MRPLHANGSAQGGDIILLRFQTVKTVITNLGTDSQTRLFSVMLGKAWPLGGGGTGQRTRNRV